MLKPLDADLVKAPGVQPYEGVVIRQSTAFLENWPYSEFHQEVGVQLPDQLCEPGLGPLRQGHPLKQPDQSIPVDGIPLRGEEVA